VEAVIDLALEVPCELRMIQVARVDRQHILMHRHARVLQIDQNLDDAVRLARGKREQRMLVKTEMVKNLGKLRRFGHEDIVVELAGRCLIWCQGEGAVSGRDGRPL